MRIVGGKHRGRRLAVPAKGPVRPTPDRVREAVFNILAHASPALPADPAVLDLFAGTGANGLEALSRGAAHATFIDNNRDCRACIAANIEQLGESPRARVIGRDATRPGAAPQAFDLVFVDPPYRRDMAPPALAALAAHGWLTPGATIIVEVAHDEPFPAPPGYRLIDERSYATTRIVRLTWQPDAPA